jgi:hypothetical protein
MLEDDLALHGETQRGPQIHSAAHDTAHIDPRGREGCRRHLSPAPHLAIDVIKRACLKLSEAGLHLIVRNVQRARDPARRELRSSTYVKEDLAARPTLHDLM